ncbi:MAG: ROK family protein [Candidatus Latescibacteria bacterium]|jgi:glucokinase|nr:ROK family protein [Candidatus Latescibacterota bacterium]
MAETKFIGIDLGGTTITAGIVEGSAIVKLKTIPTPGGKPAEEIFSTIAGLIEDISTGHSIGGIGIGVPAPSGPETDVLFLMENLPTMEGFPLKSRLKDRFKLPVLLENDANCMALGELCAGALKGYVNCACITLGTGLGCGIIIDGKIYRGEHYCAGEIWNIPYTGTTLEESVSIDGLKAIYREISGNDLEPDALYEKFLDGDREIVQAFERYGKAVGNVMVMVLSFIDPEKIAIGGGLSQSFDAFRDGMAGIVEKNWGKDSVGKIVPAELSSKAAILGVVVLLKDYLNRV